MIHAQLVKPKQYTIAIKLTEYIYNESDLSKQLISFFDDQNIPEAVKYSFFDYLSNKAAELREILNHYFDKMDSVSHFTPVFLYSERRQEMAVILANLSQPPDDPGEPGSVLGFARMAFYGEDFLCSDCSGQLSCSSCAVEVVKGKPKNPDMREEEYDMLSIDPDMIPTDFSRLSCQTLVGDEPLMVIIRKYGK